MLVYVSFKFYLKFLVINDLLFLPLLFIPSAVMRKSAHFTISYDDIMTSQNKPCRHKTKLQFIRLSSLLGMLLKSTVQGLVKRELHCFLSSEQLQNDISPVSNLQRWLVPEMIEYTDLSFSLNVDFLPLNTEVNLKSAQFLPLCRVPLSLLLLQSSIKQCALNLFRSKKHKKTQAHVKKRENSLRKMFFKLQDK